MASSLHAALHVNKVAVYVQGGFVETVVILVTLSILVQH